MTSIGRRRAVRSCALLVVLVIPLTAGVELDGASARNEPLPLVRGTLVDRTSGSYAIVRAGVRQAAAPLPADAASPSDRPVAPGRSPAAPPPTPPPHLLEANQVVVFYGSPISEGLGILGKFTPEEAADRVRRMAFKYDRVNGSRGAIAAMDLIYAMAMDHPTDNGLYLRYLDDATVKHYLRAAHEQDLQHILDLQIGRGEILDEVRKIERFLLDPRVHVAIDPEYAVGPDGAPIVTPGWITGNEINAVQEYVAALVRDHGLPQKMVIIHQYLDETVVDGHTTRAIAEVELVLNMDAFGESHQKHEKYRQFAERAYAERDSYNILLKQDDRVPSEQEVLELSPEPDAVSYQ